VSSGVARGLERVGEGVAAGGGGAEPPAGEAASESGLEGSCDGGQWA